mmetsp:Transcript_53991/g.142893  ORF Transcript_53991/g.142893 Transcript_53991/m.142893 type:complete len:122 (-) Transcript_53991:292-657(-)
MPIHTDVARDLEELEMPSGFRESLMDLENVSLNQVWEDVRKEAADGLENVGWVSKVEELAKEALRQAQYSKSSEEEFSKLLVQNKMRSACQSIPFDLKKQLLEYIASIVQPEVNHGESMDD